MYVSVCMYVCVRDGDLGVHFLSKSKTQSIGKERKGLTSFFFIFLK